MLSLMGSGGRNPQGAVVEVTDVCRLFLNRIKQCLHTCHVSFM